MKTLTFSVVLLASFVACAQNPMPKGERVLSMDINESEDVLYDAGIDKVMALGIREVPLFLNWNTIETTPRAYDATLLEIANTYYPTKGIKLFLTLTPIHTNQNVMPSDLQDKSLSDPEVIARFKTLLEFVFANLPEVELSSLVIGSAMDVYFGNDPVLWRAYQTFFTEISAYVQTKKPGLSVAAEATFVGLTDPRNKTFLQTLYPEGSTVGVSYYPLESDFRVREPSVVQDDFQKLHQLFPKRSFTFYQIGYPSSPEIGSSEEKQSAFIREVFKAWDNHAETMPLMIFSWLHDISPETLQRFEEFYGLLDKGFLAFLASLGFRTYETPSRDKLAFQTLLEEAKRRGW